MFLFEVVSTLGSITCAIILFVSFYAHLFMIPENRCEMTYMFQYPAYLEIPMSKRVKEKFPRYGLFVYGEGSYAERLSRGVFDGIPVLFIPGNAGSHRQVRSLASVSMKKTETARGSNVPKFNYFTIDYDEELSGLYGGYLERQTEFASACLRRILALYKGSTGRPRSVVVIGHSMGGIVARGLFLTPNVSSLIQVIITLASPHAIPPATFDFAMDDYYSRIHRFWSDNAHTVLENVTILSVSGDRNDVMVRPSITLFERSLKAALLTSTQPDSGLSVFEASATSIPLVWLSTDHLCIVWCKQLVLVVVRSLFDMANRSQISSNVSMHRAAIRYHFFDRNDWVSRKDVMEMRQARLTEEEQVRERILSNMAAVFRDYLHTLPALSVWYICVMLALDHVKGRYHQNRGGSIFGQLRDIVVLVSSALGVVRISNNDYVSVFASVVLVGGVLTVTKGLARLLVSALCCSRCFCVPRLSEQRFPWILGQSLIALSLVSITALYSWSWVIFVLMISFTLLSQISDAPSDPAVPTKRATEIAQLCVISFILTMPWIVVSVQNLRHGQTALPHDPTMFPAILWTMGYCIPSIPVSYQKLAITPLIAALVAIGFCDRLYVTLNCCSVVLGLYSRGRWTIKQD